MGYTAHELLLALPKMCGQEDFCEAEPERLADEMLMVRYMIEHGKRIDPTGWARGLLEGVVELCDVSLVESLLARGFSPTPPLEEWESSPLHTAIRTCQRRTAIDLMNAEASLKEELARTPRLRAHLEGAI